MRRASCFALALSLIALAAVDAEAREATQLPLADENTVEIAAVLERLKADLAGRKGATAAEVKTISAAAVVWRDTSMGCGKPTESYAQIDVEGYEVVLEYAGQRFDYRARKDGSFVLCESGI